MNNIRVRRIDAEIVEDSLLEAGFSLVKVKHLLYGLVFIFSPPV